VACSAGFSGIAEFSPSMNTKHPGIRAPAWVRWYADGLIPTSSVNRCENDPRLLYPTSPQTSVTVRLVARSRSVARSIRRRVTYCIGVSPYSAAKQRRKWYFDTPAAAASPARSSGSA
jgi:hypothetical protein